VRRTESGVLRGDKLLPPMLIAAHVIGKRGLQLWKVDRGNKAREVNYFRHTPCLTRYNCYFLTSATCLELCSNYA